MAPGFDEADHAGDPPFARVAADIATILRGTPGTENVDNPLRLRNIDLRLDFDRDAAALFGVLLAEIDRMSRLVVAGPVVSRFREPDGDEHDIRLTVPHGERQDLSGFDALQVPAMTGSYVPIRQLADLRQARIEFSGEELADLVTRVATSGLGGGDWKSAIVVADPVQYGVSRQCQVFAEHFSRDAILHDVESALAWLVGEE